MLDAIPGLPPERPDVAKKEAAPPGMHMGNVQAYEGLVPKLPAEGTAWIAPTAAVVGDVVIGVDVSFWYGAAVRGDNEAVQLGRGSNVQENAVLHVDPGFPVRVGEDVTIGHGAILHGCEIGDGTTVGMGAIVLNGARIGRNCLIAAGALILERTEIPAGSLVVGSPGQIKRTLSQEVQDGLLKGAEVYREKARKLLRPMRVETKG
ncbi:MAG: gamma carbonic anhydrase family protein [Pseudomonadota bacterium]